MQEFLRPKEACDILRVSQRTLLLWEERGTIRSFKTKGRHRRYLKSDIFDIINDGESKEKEKEEDKRRDICYCRVSTKEQKEDLERQIEFFRYKYPNHEIIHDFGSGINFRRKGFNQILVSAIKGNIREIVVTHKDRLCRFGFELISRIIKEGSDGKIVVLNQKETSPEKELVDDIISIITVFSSRIYGLRSHKIKNQIKGIIQNTQVQDISNTTREECIDVNDGSVQMVL